MWQEIYLNLHQKQLLKGKNFVKNYKSWTEDQWKKIIVIDESNIINKRMVKEKVWRKKNQSLDLGKYKETIKYHQGTIKLLGIMTYKVTFRFIKIKKRFTGLYFLELLKEHLKKKH